MLNCCENPDQHRFPDEKVTLKMPPKAMPEAPEEFSFGGSFACPDADLVETVTDQNCSLAEVAELSYAKSQYESHCVQLASNTPQIITSGTPPYRVIDVNPKWLLYCGFKKEDVMGNTLNIL